MISIIVEKPDILSLSLNSHGTTQDLNGTDSQEKEDIVPRAGWSQALRDSRESTTCYAFVSPVEEPEVD